MARQRKPLQPNREPGISSVTSAAVVPGSDWLELVVKVTALVAVVLPFVGAGVRAIAFGLAGFQNPIDLAGQDGVPDLGATAIKAVAVTAIGLPVVVFYAYWRWRRGPPLNFEGAIKWIRRAVILALAALLLLFAPPGNAVMVIVGFWGGAQVSGWARTQQLTFYRAAAIILVTAAVSAVGAGLNGIAVERRGEHIYVRQRDRSPGWQLRPAWRHGARLAASAVPDRLPARPAANWRRGSCGSDSGIRYADSGSF